MNGVPGLGSQIMDSNKSYCIYFKECTCPLCQERYVDTPYLCECSRQSVLYTLRTLWPEKGFAVELCHTILRGDKDCKLLITVTE